jgi:hypothetical protein
MLSLYLVDDGAIVHARDAAMGERRSESQGWLAAHMAS